MDNEFIGAPGGGEFNIQKMPPELVEALFKGKFLCSGEPTESTKIESIKSTVVHEGKQFDVSFLLTPSTEERDPDAMPLHDLAEKLAAAWKEEDEQWHTTNFIAQSGGFGKPTPTYDSKGKPIVMAQFEYLGQLFHFDLRDATLDQDEYGHQILVLQPPHSG